MCHLCGVSSAVNVVLSPDVTRLAPVEVELLHSILVVVWSALQNFNTYKHMHSLIMSDSNQQNALIGLLVEYEMKQLRILSS